MNKKEKEIAKKQLDDEQKTIRELKQLYTQAHNDVQSKIAELGARESFDPEHIQQIIYQKNVQETILKQIDEALKQLDSKQYDTIEAFLQDSYNNGYVGSMYTLHDQGIPVLQPVDKKKVIKALHTDSKLSVKYYSENPLRHRCGHDIRFLKNSIRAEVSRGILEGKTWTEVAYKVAKGMNNPIDKSMNDAMRIARTEGHRINQEGFLDAGDVAVEKGADIVKQWDATLDTVTRPWHQEADGQIVDWKEFFTVGGEKMKAPAVGGSAKNVCNCRCQLLQRAKWSLDEEDLEKMKKRAEFFGLDKTKDFEEFKQKYLKIPDSSSLKTITEETKKALSSDDLKVQGRTTVWNHWDEYRQKYLQNAVSISDVDLNNPSLAYDTFNISTLHNVKTEQTVVDTVSRLGSKFYSPLTSVKTMAKEETLGNSAFATTWHGWGYGTAEIRINPLKFGDKGIKRIQELAESGYSVKMPKGKEIEYIITHEYGHSIFNVGESLPSKAKNFVQADFSDVKKARDEVTEIYARYSSEVKRLQDEYDAISKPIDSKFIFEGIAPTDEERQVLKSAREKLESVKISKYSLTNIDEFVAESFADVEIGENPSKYSKEVHDVIVKYFGKGD